MPKQTCIWLSPVDRAALGGWVADRNTPQKLVWRARIVLMSAPGTETMTVVRGLGKSKRTVGRWQERYLAQGIDGLRRDASRPGRKPPLSSAVIERVVAMTLRETPPRTRHCRHPGVGVAGPEPCPRLTDRTAFLVQDAQGRVGLDHRRQRGAR